MAIELNRENYKKLEKDLELPKDTKKYGFGIDKQSEKEFRVKFNNSDYSVAVFLAYYTRKEKDSHSKTKVKEMKDLFWGVDSGKGNKNKMEDWKRKNFQELIEGEKTIIKDKENPSNRIDRQNISSQELGNIAWQDGPRPSPVYGQCFILRKPVKTIGCDDLKNCLIDRNDDQGFVEALWKQSRGVNGTLMELVANGVQESAGKKETSYILCWKIEKK